MATELSEAPASPKVNESAQGVVALKFKHNINISSNSSDKKTMTDDDSVEAMLPTVLNIALTNSQYNFGVYLLRHFTKEDRATYSAFKPNTHDYGYDTIKDMHNSI